MSLDVLPGENSLRNRYDQKYFIFDTETSSVNLVDNKNLPWNIGGILMQGEKVLAEYDWYPYFPNLEMSAGAIAVNNFDPIEYKKKSRLPEEVWEEFAVIYYDPEIILVGHNILNLDVHTINHFRNFLDMPNDFSYIDQGRIIDTNCLAKAYLKGMKVPPFSNVDDFMCWQLKLVEFHERSLKTNLNFMSKHFELKVDESRLHTALYDVFLNMSVFFKLIKTMGI